MKDMTQGIFTKPVYLGGAKEAPKTKTCFIWTKDRNQKWSSSVQD